MRQLTDDDLLARGNAITQPAGAVVLPPVPGWHQLLYAAAGVLRVETDPTGRAGGEVRVLPPHRAMWLPDGSTARVVAASRVTVRTLYLRVLLRQPDHPLAVDVPPLLRELVLHAVLACPLRRDSAEHRRLVDVIGDRLAAAPAAPELLPLPTDPRALALARTLQDDLTSDRSLPALAVGTGAGARTLERLFLAETGMTISRWRQRMRLLRALELLATGTSVTEVAAAVGYATPSAFTAMFRSHLGRTPGSRTGVSPGRRGASAGGRPR